MKSAEKIKTARKATILLVFLCLLLSAFVTPSALSDSWKSPAGQEGTEPPVEPTSTLTETLPDPSATSTPEPTLPEASPTAEVQAQEANTIAPAANYITVGYGTFDDTFTTAVDYQSGSWDLLYTPGPYGNTIHSSDSAGASVKLLINTAGTSRVILHYATIYAAGMMNISIDSGLTVNQNINAYSPTLIWDRDWESPTLSAGAHTLEITSIEAGKRMYFDAVTIDVEATPTPTVTNTNTITSSPTVSSTPTITLTPTQTNTQTPTSTRTATRTSLPSKTFTSTPIPYGTGWYDDAGPEIIYTGSWNSLYITGPYSNTNHYTNNVGATASLSFTGNRVTYKFPMYYNRGHARISIDGSTVATISLYSEGLFWQQTWISPLLSTGDHTITVTVVDGVVDVDAFYVESLSATYTPTLTSTTTETPVNSPTSSMTPTVTQTPTLTLTTTTTATRTIVPLGPVATAGWVDDTSPSVVYTTSDWQELGIPSGPFFGTTHYTNKSNARATMTFIGNQIRYYYPTFYDRGVVQVQIDNFDMAYIDLYSPTLVWQEHWESPILSSGQHTITLTRVNGTIDLDAFYVFDTGPTLTPTGTLTPTQSQTPTQSATPTETRTITQTPTITNTATIVPVGPIANPGLIDDTAANVAYTGSWMGFNTSGPVNNTTHYTSQPGATAALTFNGNRVTFIYPTYYNRGHVNIYIDNVLLTTLNLYSASLLWQQTWASGVLDNGVHTIKLVASDGYVDVDAFLVEQTVPTYTPTITNTPTETATVTQTRTITNTPTITPTRTATSTAVRTPVGPVAGIGPVDDTSSSVVYGGKWETIYISGPTNNTNHYSNAVGSTASMTFNGTRVTYVYPMYYNRGRAQISIDGVVMAVVNLYSEPLLWQQTWVSPLLPNTDHTIIITALDKVIDVDGFIVQ